MAIFSRTNQTGRPESAARRGEPAGLTIIAVGTTVVGDISAEGVIKIEGTVEGTVRAATQLLVAPGAIIRGDVHGAEIIAGGEIHGAVQADDRVEIQAGAVVDGDIRTLKLHIADGGRVNGQITMEPSSADRSERPRAVEPSEIL